MKLHTLKSSVGSRKKRTRKGRGLGSGLGKTAGRGENGQKSRSGGGVRPGFEGGQNPLFRRIPKVGFKNINKVSYQVVSLSQLEKHFIEGDTIDKEILLKKRIISKKNVPFKVLANGKISKKINIIANQASKEAIKEIEKVGGTIKIINIKKKERLDEKNSKKS